MKLLNKKNREFTEIFSNYYSLVFSTVYSKVGDADTADDITQEVFIRFYKKIDEIENPRKWLYGTLRHVVVDYYRKKKENHIDVDSLFEDISMTFVNGFRDTRIMIEEALNTMENFIDETGRIIFDLIAVRNFTYKKAAQQVGKTERHVRYKYGLILERLTDYFRKQGIHSLEELL